MLTSSSTALPSSKDRTAHPVERWAIDYPHWILSTRSEPLRAMGIEM
jgi:hypothetical protein